MWEILKTRFNIKNTIIPVHLLGQMTDTSLVKCKSMAQYTSTIRKKWQEINGMFDTELGE